MRFGWQNSHGEERCAEEEARNKHKARQNCARPARLQRLSLQLDILTRIWEVSVN